MQCVFEVLLTRFLGFPDVDTSVPYPREAYVTLVTTVQYIIGAEVLAKCLRHTNTERQLVALVGELVPEEGIYVLEDAGYETIRVPSVPTNKKVYCNIFGE